MSLLRETRELRKALSAGGGDPEWSLLHKYDLLRKKPPQSWVERFVYQTKRLLAIIPLMHPPITKYPWLPTLKHAEPQGESRTLLIWAMDADKDSLRSACEGFLKHLKTESSTVPVLVTDCADFAYFSRLQWLVEYVPTLTGTGPSYRERKMHYLAWRYRDALVVPASAGMASDTEWKELMEMRQ